jgi:2OG-Fe(II) oxygenase superfamily
MSSNQLSEDRDMSKIEEHHVDPRGAPAAQKDKPIAFPLATALIRYIACETLPWFMNYKGGLQTNDSIIRGILFDKFGSQKAHLGQYVAINSISSEKSTLLESKIIAATKTIEERAFTGLLISETFPQLEVKFREGETVGVAGFWRISHSFALKFGNSVELNVRFAYEGPQDEIWWRAGGHHEDETSDGQFEEKRCKKCTESCITIFEEGWICTNALCSDIGKDENGGVPSTRTYLKKFLLPFASERQTPASSLPQLLPSQPQNESLTGNEAKDLDIMQGYVKGWVCPLCRSMNRRTLIPRYHCKCGNVLEHTPPSVPIDRLIENEFLHLAKDDALPGVKKSPFVKELPRSHNSEYATYQFELCNEAVVMIVCPRTAVHTKSGGDNDLYDLLQAGARDGSIPLERKPFNDPSTFTSFFTAPYGEKYNTKMLLTEISFDAAAQVVQQLRGEAGALVLRTCGEDADFNQSLVNYYPSGKGMGFHADNERDLGSFVYSKSFGSTAVMKFRIKQEFDCGYKKRGKTQSLVEDDSVIPGCKEYKDRKALLDTKDSGEISGDQYEKLALELVKDLKQYDKRTKQDILELRIPHGGIVVMKGNNFQRCFEHSVDSPGLQRYVITFRHIGEGHSEDTVKKLAGTASKKRKQAG